MKTGPACAGLRKTKTKGRKGNMDAKKLTAMLIGVLLAVPVLTAASQGTLAVIDVALIGLLYIVRRRRTVMETARYGG
jgi:hypothetical protein